MRNRILRFFNQNTKLSAITPHKIEQYMAMRFGRVKPGTINRELTFLRGMYTKAIKWGYIKSSPMTAIDKLKEERKPERFLSPQQKTDLLEACSEGILDIVCFALKTGMRMSELIHLEWKNVNLDTNRITVVNTKSHKVRAIPISKESRERLKKMSKHSKYVFGIQNGNHWDLNNLGKKFKAACEKAKLALDFSFHDLRHSFARDMLDRKVDIYTVSQLLGHSSLVTTQRYLSQNEPVAEAAIERLDDLNGAQSVYKSVNSDLSDT